MARISPRLPWSYGSSKSYANRFEGVLVFGFLKRLFRRSQPTHANQDLPASYPPPPPFSPPPLLPKPPARPPRVDRPQQKADAPFSYTDNQSSPRRMSTLGIIYRDANEESTSRIVTIRDFVDGQDGPTHFQAVCHLRGALRMFRIDRVEGMFDPETGEILQEATLEKHSGDVPEFNRNQMADKRVAPEPQSISAIFTLYETALQNAGWTPSLETAGSSERLGCHRLGKRGKPLKNPAISLHFDAFSDDSQVDMESGEIIWNKNLRKRPWTVRSEDFPSRSFGSVEPALRAFLNAAKVEKLTAVD